MRKTRRQKVTRWYLRSYMFMITIPLLMIMFHFSKDIHLSFPHYIHSEKVNELLSPIPASFLPGSNQPGPRRGVAVKTIDDIKLACVKLARKWHVNPAVMMGQYDLESNHGRSSFCLERGNCFGLGAFDSNPDNAFHFDNQVDGCEFYAKFVTGNQPDDIYPSPLIKNGYKYAATLYNNAKEQIKAIKVAGYATDPDYVEKVLSMDSYQLYNY